MEQTANIFFNEFLFLASSSICSTVSRVVRIVHEQSIDTASIVACALLGRALLDYGWELVRTWFCLASVVVYELPSHYNCLFLTMIAFVLKSAFGLLNC